MWFITNMLTSNLITAEIIVAIVMAGPLLFCLFCDLYQLRLLSAALKLRSRLQQAPPFIPPVTPSVVVDVQASTFPATELPQLLILIPAHNEELLIARTLASVARAALRYGPDRIVTAVIADNCSDSTESISHAGYTNVEVIVRNNEAKVGKGYALADAIAAVLTREIDFFVTSVSVSDRLREFPFDALVILDADTVVHPDILCAFGKRILAGSGVLQGVYGVYNTEQSWRTRMMSCAFSLIHLVKPAGREWLGLSDSLKGNGICLTRDLVERFPWPGGSLTEDIEYSLTLCRAGVRIEFVPEAVLWAEMPVSGGAASGQRRRWEAGRYRLVRENASELLRLGIRTRDMRVVDRAIELIIPPFVELTAIHLLFLTVSVAMAGVSHLHGWAVLAGVWLAMLGALTLYIIGGLNLARVPFRVARSLLIAPFYMVWKLALLVVMVVSRPVLRWKRTARETPQRP